MTGLGEMRAWAARSDAPKKAVGIERLLHWAYQEELVHASRPDYLPVEAVQGYDPGLAQQRAGSATAEGVPVSSSKSFGWVAPEDARRVDAAVQSLRPVELRLPETCVGRFDPNRFAKGYGMDVPMRFTVKRSQLVAVQAIRGERPDWVSAPVLRVEKGEAIYKRYAGGRLVRDRNGNVIEEVTIVRFVGDMPWEVARERLIYNAWADALAELKANLRGVLERFVLIDELPPRDPWAPA